MLAFHFPHWCILALARSLPERDQWNGRRYVLLVVLPYVHCWHDSVAAFVTQCPIAANNSFLYNFTASDQAGTFWYHSHLGLQYCDGLRGPMVIYDPADPHASLYDIDDGLLFFAVWLDVVKLTLISSQNPPSWCYLIGNYHKYIFIMRLILCLSGIILSLYLTEKSLPSILPCLTVLADTPGEQRRTLLWSLLNKENGTISVWYLHPATPTIHFPLTATTWLSSRLMVLTQSL